MSESTVVQLARFNTTDYASNTEWRTTLHQPIIMNEGDQAVVSKAYLDSRLNAGGNIVIETDIDLSLTYYFYQMFSPDGTSFSTISNANDVYSNTSYPPGFPKNDKPPVVPTQVELAPNDYQVWTTDMLRGPFYDGFTPTSITEGNWDNYQYGTNTESNPYNATPNPRDDTWWYYLNDGVPQAPWAYFNNPFPYPNFKFSGNQCYAGEIPLLLTSVPRGPDVPLPNHQIDTSIPYTKVWNYTLKAGTYAPAQLAEVLTRAMSQIQPAGEERTNYTAYDQYGTSQNPPKLNAFMAKGQVVGLINSTDGSDPQPRTPGYALLPPYAYDNGNLPWAEGMTYATNDTANPLYPQNNYILSTFLVDSFIPPKYLRGDLYNAVTPNNPQIFQQTKYTSSFMMNFGNTVKGTINYETPVIGCSEPEIVFNDQAGVFQFVYTHTPLQELPTGGGAAGTNTESAPIEVVKIVKTTNIDYYAQTTPPSIAFVGGDVNICEHTKHSGIIFQKMEPIEFWSEVLGFDVPNLIAPPELIWGTNRSMDFAKFKQITTSGFVGLQNNFNYKNRAPGSDDPSTTNLNLPPYIGPAPVYPPTGGTPIVGSLNGPLTYTNLLNSARWFSEQYILRNPSYWFLSDDPNTNTYNFPYASFFPLYYEEYASALTATNPISAISPPLSNVGNVGHYLIEIVAYGKDKEMITNNTVYQIKSIVSSYYQSANSFQSAPYPDTYSYNHVGETQVIHSFKVRIIDPYTMDTATNLGPSSSVYIQFNKGLDKIALAQPS